ncbi:MAG: hypothetical protein ACRC46_07995 [Thermoguttaceae bacterium]
MRLTSYLLLLVSFACGIAGSFLIAYTFFWKKVVVAAPTQMIPIIVAKDDIPVGAEIAAAHVTFEHVAVDDVPDGAVARFSDVLYGRTLYPISRGYPICRDMIVPRRKSTDSKATGFVPIGFRVVPVEVTQPPGSTTLEVNERVNLMVDRSDSTSRFELMRQETLGGRATIKPVLDGVLVHEVSEVAASDTLQHHVVSLLLTNEQYEMLLSASQEGKLRIAIAAPPVANSVSTPQVAATAPVKAEPTPPVSAAVVAPVHKPVVSAVVNTAPPMVAAPAASPFTETVLDEVPLPVEPASQSQPTAPATASAWETPVVSSPFEIPSQPQANEIPAPDCVPESATAKDSDTTTRPAGKALFVRPSAASSQRLSTQNPARPEHMF